MKNVHVSIYFDLETPVNHSSMYCSSILPYSGFEKRVNNHLYTYPFSCIFICPDLSCCSSVLYDAVFFCLVLVASNRLIRFEAR